MKKFLLKRRIKAGSVTSKRALKAEAQERYADKLIIGNPHYAKIREAIREGDSVRDIARWFVNEGWTHVSEGAFYSALTGFRLRHPELLLGDEEDLDGVVSGNRPNTDPLIEMNKLYRLQKKRIFIDYKNEQNLGKLFTSMNDEMKVATEMVTNIAKISGKFAGGENGAANNPNARNYDPDVQDDLRNIRLDEQSREKMKALTGTFLKKLNQQHAT